MNLAASDPSGADRLSWAELGALLLFAALVRWLSYTGFFGSDEVTYTESAFKLLRGDWSVDSYVGANRYGVNLPVAAFGWLFGPGEFSAAIYSLLCSLAEVLLLAAVGARMFGRRVGLWAGVLLACLPIQVHFAGRMMADAPLCLAITACFVFFYDGEVRRRPISYLLAGLAAGWSFWIKPHAIFYVVILAAYPLVARRIDLRWGWAVVGAAIMVLANCALFGVLSGDPMFLFKAISERRDSGYLEQGMADGGMKDAAHFYLVYLFGKVYHTGLIGYLAVAAIVAQLWRPRPNDATQAFAFRYLLWWALGMVLVLSVMVVSLKPLLFVPKQTNYMLMFVAPLCLLAGHGLARLSGKPLVLVAVATIAPALLFGLLLQGSVAVFTANSRATVALAERDPATLVYTSSNPLRAAQFARVLRGQGGTGNVRGLGEAMRPSGQPTSPALAVIDTQTLAWGDKEALRGVDDVPACWVREGVLTPQLTGAGAWLLGAAAGVADRVAPGASLTRTLGRMARPLPAYLYRIPAERC